MKERIRKNTVDALNLQEDYVANTEKYKQAINELQKYQYKSDSINTIISSASLAETEKVTCKKLVELAMNDISGDVYTEVKSLDAKLVLSLNRVVVLTSLYDMDSKVTKLRATLKTFDRWESSLCKFIDFSSINYFNAVKVKVADSVFLKETKLYRFKKGDVIADLGAGSGYFEKVLSKYCDNLKVYVNEIESGNLPFLKTKIAFLEESDNKNISYIGVLGDAKSSQLPSNEFDKVIIRNTFHHFKAPNEMLQDCKRILKKNGRLFIVDIMLDEVIQTPACSQHFTRSVFLNFLQQNGFELLSETHLDYDEFKLFEFKAVQ